ncbi:hypothetical protein B0I35DRAFT_437135 [Stachybotrys elegans]|uniref:T6SS Phospholipase effector Tle1-like catalytic domain-containing protein n=1 Tax=Stachybotrys elegans TaxID=80388 RepID=A0A8K0SS54_9HYPO|nr:hypothetical protein B0I35DRAFT_437135 [Stachybotrys elegans]
MSCALPPSWTTDDEDRFEPCAHLSPDTDTHKKRLIVCCDGTWNNSNAASGKLTNVSHISSTISHMCCNGMSQVVYYHPGPGTEESWVAKKLGGLLGQGALGDIADTYRFICDNYCPGDEIVLIGFSRGAFIARSVAGMVCSIGLLNSHGLAHFGEIFRDYQSFSKWNSDTKFDPKVHLTSLNMANEDHLGYEEMRLNPGTMVYQPEGTPAEREAKLNVKKKEIFESMTSCKPGRDRLQKMADIYQQEFLGKLRMLVRKRASPDDPASNLVPVDPRVKAIGVWDTVGSLGFPKMVAGLDMLRPGRSAEELRFASFDVHEKVDYAFHALALDEWRHAFKPTLWSLPKLTNGADRKTHLRQVWFPGSHSDVGGGGDDQQIAMISLAWMADQLASIGVEFVPAEMARIFNTANLGTDVRPWGLGKISNPGFTATPDRIYDGLMYPIEWLRGGNTVHGTRTPGLYPDENEHHDGLQNGGTPEGPDKEDRQHELIHPSVRIRLHSNGKALDDNGTWGCIALKKNGYQLDKATEAHPAWAQFPQAAGHSSLSKTLTGCVIAVQGDQVDAVRASLAPTNGSQSGVTVNGQSKSPKNGGDWRNNEEIRRLVKQRTFRINNDLATHVVPRQLPFEEDLCTPEKGIKEETLYQPQGQSVAKPWVWKSKGKTLHEERVGIWERLLFQVSKDLYDRRLQSEQGKADDSRTQSSQSSMFSVFKFGWGGTANGPTSTSTETNEIRHNTFEDVITSQKGDGRTYSQRARVVEYHEDEQGNASFAAVL